MQTGISLVELARRIEANRELKHDLIAETSALHMRVDTDGKLGLDVADENSYGILNTGHNQIGSRLNIPAKYYDRMKDSAPQLLADNVNHWFKAQPAKRLIRTLGGDARAMLSNSYQRIDNEVIAETILPILGEIPGVEFKSTQITDSRMYIQAVSPRMQGEVRKGDVVQAGVIISNSEIGYGSASVQPMIWRLVCLNGMVMPDGKYATRHVGSRIDNSADLWSDDTKRLDDRAVLSKMRDVVRAAVNDVRFNETLDKMRIVAGLDISPRANPAKAVEVLAKRIGATEAEQGSILTSLIHGGDLSAWGFANAVTHQAHAATSYDRAVEFATLGGSLLDLPRTAWQEILTAA